MGWGVVGFPAVVSGGAGSTGRWVLRVGRTVGSGWSGQGQRGSYGGGQFVGPGPGFGDADGASALAADDAGGGVQEPVAQGLGFGFGEVTVEAEQA